MLYRFRSIIVGSFLLAIAVSNTALGAERGIPRNLVYRQVGILAQLGRMLFFDPGLSASGQLSCASCHDPAHAYGPSNARPVQSGGKDMRQMGLRAVPSLRYGQVTPHFTEHFFDDDDEPNAGVDNGPTGGLSWDGRADRARDQARLPLLSTLEMANESPSVVVNHVKQSSYAGLLRKAFGTTIFYNKEKAFVGILEALDVLSNGQPSSILIAAATMPILQARRRSLTRKLAGLPHSTILKRAIAPIAIPAP
jgi:cytochrome c peroxidase